MLQRSEVAPQAPSLQPHRQETLGRVYGTKAGRCGVGCYSRLHDDQALEVQQVGSVRE